MTESTDSLAPLAAQLEALLFVAAEPVASEKIGF